MRTSKKQLNDLVKIIADKTKIANNKAEAIKNGQTSYLWLTEGYDKFYTLSEITIPNGTRNMPFMLGHHAYKAGEMSTLLKGIIAGLSATK